MEREKIIIKRRYKASLQGIWDLWTTKEGFEKWWGPQEFRVEVQVLEAKPGGLLRYTMIAATPQSVKAMQDRGQAVSHAVRSTFSEFKPKSRLALTNVIDFIPGVDAYESVIAVDFSEQGGVVEMVSTLHGMHSEEFTRMQEAGYTSQLSKLDGMLA